MTSAIILGTHSSGDRELFDVPAAKQGWLDVVLPPGRGHSACNRHHVDGWISPARPKQGREEMPGERDDRDTCAQR